MSPGCREQLPPLEFLRWIWTYPAKRRPGQLALLAAFERNGGRVVVLRDAADREAFLSGAAADAEAVSIEADTVSEERIQHGM
jgi:hypothetical protein